MHAQQWLFTHIESKKEKFQPSSPSPLYSGTLTEMRFSWASSHPIVVEYLLRVLTKPLALWFILIMADPMPLNVSSIMESPFKGFALSGFT